jgi:hypothetical protein
MKLIKFYIENGYIYADSEYRDGDDFVINERAIKLPMVEFSNNYQINASKEFIHDLIESLNNSL